MAFHGSFLLHSHPKCPSSVAATLDVRKLRQLTSFGWEKSSPPPATKWGKLGLIHHVVRRKCLFHPSDVIHIDASPKPKPHERRAYLNLGGET